MRKQLLNLIIILLVNPGAAVNHLPEEIVPGLISDGPYFYKETNKLKVSWIENNLVFDDYVTMDNFPEVKNRFNLLFDYGDLISAYSLKPVFTQSYRLVDSICVITDIHGEYHGYINLLTASGIIDKNLNWKFGKGHLVILGDIFDRGDMTTEVLWHLFGLEKEAEKAGGMVHILLGNHEYMVLSDNLTNTNEKYKSVGVIFKKKYSDLFSDGTVLGKWLRSKPVIISINNILFVHAGISFDMLKKNLKIRQINRIFSAEILGKDKSQIYKNERLKFLSGAMGPLWYRGYFANSGLSEEELDSILRFYRVDHIVVGHTVGKDVRSLFRNKIIGTDAGLMYKQPGGILLYKYGIFYKADITGKRTLLN